MSKPLKVVSLAVVAVLVAALVAGIAWWSLAYEPGKQEPGLYLDGKKVEDPNPIVTVGSYEVDFDLYRYFYMTTWYSYTYGDETYFDHDPDGTAREELKQSVESSLQSWFTWMGIAEKLGLTLSEEELAEIEDQIAQDKESYGTQFESRLNENYILNEEQYRYIMQGQTLINKANDALEEQLKDENIDDLVSGVATAKHILITPDGYAERAEEYEALMAGAAAGQPAGDVDGAEGEEADADPADDADDNDGAEDGAKEAGEPTEGEEPAEGEEEETTGGETPETEGDGDEDYNDARAKAFAEWLIAQIEASSNPTATFEEFRLEYDEDPGQTAEDYEGYTFAEGSMVDAFYQEAVTLDVNAISTEPVPTTYGYHILWRLPLNETYVDENFSDLFYYDIYYMVLDYYNEVLETMTITPGAYYGDVKPGTVK